MYSLYLSDCIRLVISIHNQKKEIHANVGVPVASGDVFCEYPHSVFGILYDSAKNRHLFLYKGKYSYEKDTNQSYPLNILSYNCGG